MKLVAYYGDYVDYVDLALFSFKLIDLAKRGSMCTLGIIVKLIKLYMGLDIKLG